MGDDELLTRRGYSAFEVRSAVQKSLRRSDPDSALYWAVELGQFNLGWLWKALRIVSSEDVDPRAGVVADVEALYQRSKDLKDESLYFAMHATIILATAPKGRLVDEAWGHFVERGDRLERREIPDWALDGHTRRGHQLGRHKTNTELIEFDGDLDALAASYQEAK